jgi:hypothetical protein
VFHFLAPVPALDAQYAVGLYRLLSFCLFLSFFLEFLAFFRRLMGLPPCPVHIPFGGHFWIGLPPCDFFPSFLTLLVIRVIFTMVDSQMVPYVFFCGPRDLTSIALPLSSSFFRQQHTFGSYQLLSFFTFFSRRIQLTSFF